MCVFLVTPCLFKYKALSTIHTTNDTLLKIRSPFQKRKGTRRAAFPPWSHLTAKRDDVLALAVPRVEITCLLFHRSRV